MIERKKLRQRWSVGAIVQINLWNGLYGYGIVLPGPVAFLDYKTESKEYDLDKLLSAPVLVKIWVMKYAVTQFWPIIHKIKDLSKELLENPNQFIHHNLFGQNRYCICVDATIQNDIPITFEEACLLERASVYEPHHVERRLRDHFAGRLNFTVEDSRPGKESRPFVPISEFYAKQGFDYEEIHGQYGPNPKKKSEKKDEDAPTHT